MTIKRLFLILLAAILLPGFAYAQSVPYASFKVTKEFTDTNPNTEASVDLTLSCDDGNPIDEETDFQDGDTKTFVVTNFADGMDCHVEEDPIDGYTSDVSDCVFEGVDGDDEPYDCTVYNSPNLVEVEICKEWVVDNASGGGSEVEQGFGLRLTCDNPVYANYTDDWGHYVNGKETWWVEWEDSGDVCDDGFTAAVEPNWEGDPVDDKAGVIEGTECDVTEFGTDSSVETDVTDCTNLYFAIDGDDQECTVVNTVFYEGIPTLSQYGMAIMALLMLGVGFVGFRRFV